jgi:hypothetical protein
MVKVGLSEGFGVPLLLYIAVPRNFFAKNNKKRHTVYGSACPFAAAHVVVVTNNVTFLTIQAQSGAGARLKGWYVLKPSRHYLCRGRTR